MRRHLAADAVALNQRQAGMIEGGHGTVGDGRLTSGTLEFRIIQLRGQRSGAPTEPFAQSRTKPLRRTPGISAFGKCTEARGTPATHVFSVANACLGDRARRHAKGGAPLALALRSIALLPRRLADFGLPTVCPAVVDPQT